MAILTPEDITKVSHLARLALSQTEQERLPAQMSTIFTLLETIQSTDTAGLSPMASQSFAQPLRCDQVTEPNNRDRLLACANGGKNTEAGLFLVPKVIE